MILSLYEDHQSSYQLVMANKLNVQALTIKIQNPEHMLPDTFFVPNLSMLNKNNYTPLFGI